MSDEEPSERERAPVPGLARGVGPAAARRPRRCARWASTAYPTRFERSHTPGRDRRALRRARRSRSSRRSRLEVRIAGRVLTKRGHGKASFATLGDGEAQLQVYVRQDEVGEAGLPRLRPRRPRRLRGRVGPGHAHAQGRAVGAGAASSTFLSKALLPLPEKWHGLTDVEVRYRQRYLDLIANPEARRVFEARSAMVAAIRRFLDARGYLEVETPMMQPIAGRRAGAAVRDAPQRARHGPLPAHRARAVPEAAGGRRASSGSSRSTATSGTRGSRRSTTPSSRCSSSTRPTSTAAT